MLQKIEVYMEVNMVIVRDWATWNYFYLFQVSKILKSPGNMTQSRSVSSPPTKSSKESPAQLLSDLSISLFPNIKNDPDMLYICNVCILFIILSFLYTFSHPTKIIYSEC